MPLREVFKRAARYTVNVRSANCCRLIASEAGRPYASSVDWSKISIGTRSAIACSVHAGKGMLGF